MRKATHKSQYFFAAIPLLFSIQQFFEGIVWVSLRNMQHASWTDPSAFAFLFFAQVVWPVWVPLSILMVEKDAFRRKILQVITALGIALSLVLAWRLFQFPLRAEISGFHVRYFWESPEPGTLLSAAMYLIATVGPELIASERSMRILGLLIAASFVVTRLFFGEHIISVWCYFAAAISFMVIIIVIRLAKAKNVAEARLAESPSVR